MRMITCIVTVVWAFMATVGQIVAADGPPGVNAQILSAIPLTLQEGPDRQYLGLSSSGTFSLSQIKGEMLIITIFNTYCSICQQEASLLNELYHLIQADDLERSKTKLIGIAEGNNPLEVSEFRKQYGIEFPLVADLDFSVEKAFSENIRTPMCLMVKIAGGKGLEVLHVLMGQMNPQAVRNGETLVHSSE